MPNDGSRPGDPLADALAELRDELPQSVEEADDRYWLRVGLRLGSRQPGRAGLLLERLEAAIAAPVPAGAPDTAEADVTAGAESQTPDDEVPLRSMLLVRSATLPAVDEGSIDPEAEFGWAARVTRDEVFSMGRVVHDMLAEGLTADLTKGFAITWRAGVKLPDEDFDALFRAFTELELTVCGVLAGYDLRNDARTPKPGLFGSMLGSLVPRTDTRSAEAGAILDRAGEPAQRGLVAMWNAWAAVRFRRQIPEPLFGQLVRPWVTVVGRLPEG